MSLRVLQASSRAAAAVSLGKRVAAAVPGVRAFASDVSKKDEEAAAAAAAAEDKLMAQLKEQAFEEADRTILPYQATERCFPDIEKAPMPYPEEVAILSGTDEWASGRRGKILKPARHQMQSGVHNTKHWEIRFDMKPTWANPLMGWTSAADAYGVVQVHKFDTKEEALYFAKKNNWILDVQEPAPQADYSGKLSYSYNFLPEDVANMIKRVGKKKAAKQFKHPTGHRSNWVKTLKYRGDGVVAQHGGEAKQ